MLFLLSGNFRWQRVAFFGRAWWWCGVHKDSFVIVIMAENAEALHFGGISNF